MKEIVRQVITKYAFLILCALIPLYLVYYYKISPVTLKPISITSATNFFTILLIVALIVERTLEGFIAIWRGQESRLFDVRTKHYRKEIQRLEKATSDEDKELFREHKSDYENLKHEIADFKQHTQIIALRGGLFLGLVISLIGFRSLQPLVEIKAFEPLQRIIFNWVDIILTGCVIAGGSDGIHRMATVVTRFLDSTAEKTTEKQL